METVKSIRGTISSLVCFYTRIYEKGFCYLNEVSILRHNRLIISTIILLDLIALYFAFTRFAISGDIPSFFRTGFKESEEFKTISEKYKGLN